jgi:ABC-type iron transport system FetAB permease component
VLFGGYYLFLLLLPIIGFVFGFGLGAEMIQAWLGTAFLSTITSWIVGFVMAVIFALAAYIFYFGAVGIIGFALGYALTVGILEAIGLNFGLIVWLAGAIVGIVVAVAVLLLNIQKWVVMAATSILGAGVVVGTFLFLFGGLSGAQLTLNPVHAALQSSPFWAIAFILLAIGGIVAQYASTTSVEIETYNRLTPN